VRLLFIIVEASVEAKVTGALEALGCPGYTRFTGATGGGKHGRREGSAVWPGLNGLIMAGVPEERVPAVIEELKRLSDDRAGRLALKVFSAGVEEYL
jgi:hypothetical protein